MAETANEGEPRRLVIGFFDSRREAAHAHARLTEAGIPDGWISIHDGDTASAPEPKSFWTSVKEMFLPEEDRADYAEGLRRGGTVLAVEADEARYARAADIIEEAGAADPRGGADRVVPGMDRDPAHRLETERSETRRAVEGAPGVDPVPVSPDYFDGDDSAATTDRDIPLGRGAEGSPSYEQAQQVAGARRRVRIYGGRDSGGPVFANENDKRRP